MKDLSWNMPIRMMFLILVLSISLTFSSAADTLARSNWFNSGGAMIATPGHLQTTVTQTDVSNGTPSYWTTYFAPANKPVTLAQTGDQIKVTWGFTPANIVSFSTGMPLRLALVNTPDDKRLTSDGVPPNAVYKGYATFACFYLGKLFSPMGFEARANTTTEAELLRAGYQQEYVGWSEKARVPTSGGGSSGNYYTLVMSLTRNASGGIDGISTVYASTGMVNQVSFTDTSPNTFSFNTVCILGDAKHGSAGGFTGSFDTTLFQVDFQNVLIPVLRSAPKTNGELELTWNSVPDRTYQVQYKTDLLQANWNDLGDPITATNSTTTASDVIATDPRRFYRVALLP